MFPEAIQRSGTNLAPQRAEVSVSVVPDSEVLQFLGISPEVILRTYISTEPPPLPRYHVSRPSLLSEITQCLSNHPVYVICGYPESGKSTAIAEYAKESPGSVFWFAFPDFEQGQENCHSMLYAALGRWLNAGLLLPADLEKALSSLKEPILIVLDDAHHCDAIASLSFLFTAAQANPNLSILLVGTDKHSFLTNARELGFADQRIPGFDNAEAKQFFEQLGGLLTDPQTRALERKRAFCDGHPGVLKLEHSEIRSIKTDAECSTYVSKVLAGDGFQGDVVQASLIEKFHREVPPDQIDLCQRLSVTLFPFGRYQGEALWTINQELQGFRAAWNGCILGIFEGPHSGRYSIPDIYRRSLQSELSAQQRKQYHRVIADAISASTEPKDIVEAEQHVSHLLQSGAVNDAIKAATMYVGAAIMNGPEVNMVIVFDRMHFWVKLARKAEPLSADSVRWDTLTVHVLSSVGRQEEAMKQLKRLSKSLESDNGLLDPDTRSFVWFTALINASILGLPKIAQQASLEVVDQDLPQSIDIKQPWREFFVLRACIAGGANPLPYLKTILNQRKESTSPCDPLWSEMLDYQIWREITEAASKNIEQSVSDNPEHMTGMVDEVVALASAAFLAGEANCAVMIYALAIHLTIDFQKEYPAAVKLASKMEESLPTDASQQLIAFVADTKGDALRCNGDIVKAGAAYEKSLSNWPDKDHFDRAESLMMSAICIGRRKDWLLAAKRFSESVNSYQACLASAYELPIVRSQLEASLCFIYADHIPRAIRCLVKAHSLLSARHKQSPEWVALGQLSWVIAGKFSPGEPVPELPIAGFTLGLRHDVHSAEGMMPDAPTMMLARACRSIGSPYRALRYCDTVLNGEFGQKESVYISTFALDAALDARELVAAVRYAALASQWSEMEPADKSLPSMRDFVVNWQLGRVVRLAVTTSDEPNLLPRLDTALIEFENSGVNSDDALLLHDSLSAFRDAIREGTDTQLDEMFHSAIKNDAIWIAREIAVFYCSRFLNDHACLVRNALKWYWRLAWLTIEIAPEDVDFQKQFHGQIQRQAKRLAAHLDFASAPFLHKEVEVIASGDDPVASIRRLANALAVSFCSMANLSSFSFDLACQIRIGGNVDCLAEALDAFYVRSLNLVLLPGARDAIPILKNDISSVADALKATSLAGSNPQCEHIQSLMSLVELLETGEPTPTSVHALVLAQKYADSLEDNSAAQLYVWLRHFSPSGGSFAPDFEQVLKWLLSDRVIALLEKGTIYPYVELRLRICNLMAQACQELPKLRHAAAKAKMQTEMQTPIARSAFEEVSANFSASKQAIIDIAKKLDELAGRAQAEDLINELWSACIERGNALRLAGQAISIIDSESVAKEYLRPAIAAYRTAIVAVGDIKSPRDAMSIIRPALDALDICKSLNDIAEVAEFKAVIARVKAAGDYAELIASHMEKSSTLSRDTSTNAGVKNCQLDEEDIQSQVNLLMETIGLPAERREFVEDEVRKIMRSEELKYTFCQHLQPLQDLGP